ncbi:MAG: hypothetical protein ISS36_01015 [Candidatus Aenigmarchaeota archaeon]|nr:hypothetical protein [Candidatus Aenigmarchaeota archaeon]
MFNLLKLHQSIDIGPNSWICFGGNNLHEEVKLAIERSGRTRKEIVRDLSEKFNCSKGPFEESFYNHKWIPIPILNFLIDNRIMFKNVILRNTEKLKVNTSKAKPITAVKNLTIDLCKIAGAFAADGNLHFRIGFQGKSKKHMNLFDDYFRLGKLYRFRTNNIKLASKFATKINQKNIRMWQDYNIDLTDGYKISVKKYKKLIEKTFNLNLPKLREFRNAWRLNFSNKIIARYLTTFFGFPTGKKTMVVNEPKIIKDRGNKFRGAFLQGLLTFDGCVNKRGVVYFLSKSKRLINSANEIMINNNINPQIYNDIKRERWQIRLRKIDSEKCLKFFEPYTEKWSKLKVYYGL